MISRRISLVLMAVNLGLLGTVLYLAYSIKRSPRVIQPPASTTVVTNTVTQIAVRKINSTNLLGLLSGRPGSWRQLESTNYLIYIENLRNFGCPEETIRDIIITDVGKLYARHRAALRAELQPYRFWQTVDPLTGMPAASPELQQKLRELDLEQRALIRDLLGVELHTEMARYYDDEQYSQATYNFLPVEKQGQVKSVTDRYDQMAEQIYSNSKGLLLDEDQEQLKEIERQRKAELAALLTSEEMEEYELRHSDTANSMRSQLAGFEPTEDEFRKIFRLQRTFDDEVEKADDSGPAAAALTAEVQKVLGPQRYAEYQRAQDPDYRSLVQLGERFQMAPEAAQQIYNAKQAAELYKARLESNPNLTPEQRAQLAASIAGETQKYVAGALGPEAYNAYQRSGGDWIGNLSAIDPNAAPAPTPPQPAGTTLSYDINLLPPALREYLLNPFPPPYIK